MSELNIREKWVYTQRPGNERYFLASEMANALEITLPSFYSLSKKLDLDNIKKPDGRGHMVLYFCHTALKQCEEELKRREDEKKEAAPKVEAALDPTEHPLVTDARFLRLSFFPDIVPACFAEVDE